RLPRLALRRVPEARRIPRERRGKGSHSNRPSKEREAFSRAEPAGSRSERGPIARLKGSRSRERGPIARLPPLALRRVPEARRIPASGGGRARTPTARRRSARLSAERNQQARAPSVDRSLACRLWRSCESLKLAGFP